MFINIVTYRLNMEIRQNLGPHEDQFLANSEVLKCNDGNCCLGEPDDPHIIFKRKDKTLKKKFLDVKEVILSMF